VLSVVGDVPVDSEALVVTARRAVYDVLCNSKKVDLVVGATELHPAARRALSVKYCR
jgi:hypothetical protein